MRPLTFALLLLAGAAAPLPAAGKEKDQPRPNSLTKQEMADGWLLLFDGATTFGWQAPNRSTWHVVEGMLSPGPTRPACW